MRALFEILVEMCLDGCFKQPPCEIRKPLGEIHPSSISLHYNPAHMFRHINHFPQVNMLLLLVRVCQLSDKMDISAK